MLPCIHLYHRVDLFHVSISLIYRYSFAVVIYDRHTLINLLVDYYRFDYLNVAPYLSLVKLCPIHFLVCAFRWADFEKVGLYS